MSNEKPSEPKMLAYLRRALDLYIADPPDSWYQRGYLDALVVAYEEFYGNDAFLERVRRATSGSPITCSARTRGRGE